MKIFNKKYRWFKKKLAGVEKTIWDMEFKSYKIAEIREEVRHEYDGAKNKLHNLNQQIENAPEDIKKKLEDEKVLLERDIQRFEAQMQKLDLDVEGSKPTADYPDGVTGINHQIDSLQELKVMLIKYLDEI